MQQNLLFCEKCNVYQFPNLNGNIQEFCPHCQTGLIITDISYEDYKIMPKTKRCKQCKRKYPKIFIKCPKCNKQLIKLSTEDKNSNQQIQAIIENTQTAQQNICKCPICNSTDVVKISTLSRATSVGLLGIASSKIGKQWHCNNCKSDF